MQAPDAVGPIVVQQQLQHSVIALPDAPAAAPPPDVAAGDAAAPAAAAASAGPEISSLQADVSDIAGDDMYPVQSTRLIVKPIGDTWNNVFHALIACQAVSDSLAKENQLLRQQIQDISGAYELQNA